MYWGYICNVSLFLSLLLLRVHLFAPLVYLDGKHWNSSPKGTTNKRPEHNFEITIGNLWYSCWNMDFKYTTMWPYGVCVLWHHIRRE